MAEVESKPTGGRWDLVAFILFLAGLLLTVSVVSHNPSQVPAETYPPSASGANLLGAPGAIVAENLFETLGVAVYGLLAAWFILVANLFLQHSISRLFRRFIGWVILIFCAAVITDQIGNLLAIPLNAGSGGTIGAGIARLLVQPFPFEGRVLVFGSAMVLGCYLALDSVLRWVARRAVAIVRGIGRAIRAIRLPWFRWTRSGSKKAPIWRRDSEKRVKSEVPG